MSKVIYEKQGRLALITLNRPEVMNAIDKDVHLELCRIWQELGDDDGLDVAVITGAGDAFCAGMDLKTHVPEFIGAGPQKILDWAEVGLGGLPRGFHHLEKPVIAAVNGWALAGGFELSLAADIRIASERANFGAFEARRGFHDADGGVARMINFCGVAVAMEILLTAEPIDAQRALQINMISKVVPHDKLMEEAERTAQFILRNDQAAVRSAKRTVLDMIGRTLDDQLYRECIAGYTLMADNPTVPGLLEKFYKKTDPGRAGVNSTPL
jgi:enoyl-CoA hydratase/carnithine racemase